MWLLRVTGKQDVLFTLQVEKPVRNPYPWESLTQLYSTMQKQMHQSPQYNIFHTEEIYSFVEIIGGETMTRILMHAKHTVWGELSNPPQIRKWSNFKGSHALQICESNIKCGNCKGNSVPLLTTSGKTYACACFVFSTFKTFHWAHKMSFPGKVMTKKLLAGQIHLHCKYSAECYLSTKAFDLTEN